MINPMETVLCTLIRLFLRVTDWLHHLAPDVTFNYDVIMVLVTRERARNSHVLYYNIQVQHKNSTNTKEQAKLLLLI